MSAPLFDSIPFGTPWCDLVKQVNKFGSNFKAGKWLTALFLVAFLAGCNGSGGSGVDKAGSASASGAGTGLSATDALVAGTFPAWAQTSMGGALGFSVLGGSNVTCTSGTVAGDVGVSPGSAVPFTNTGCAITGQTPPATDVAAVQARSDFLSTYAALQSMACTPMPGNLAGQNLAPGVYCLDAAAKAGVLTLTGSSDGSWVFLVDGALTGTSFSVVMAGGGQPGNVFWAPSGALTMTTSDFTGNILAGDAVGGSITFTGGTLAGRALANVAVTMTGASVVCCDAMVVVVPAPIPPIAPIVPTNPGAGTGVAGAGQGPAPVDLLSAGNFAILSASGITNTGSHTSAITGNIGSSPITAAAMNGVFCPEITGTIYGVDAAYVGNGNQACYTGDMTVVGNAVLDVGTAFTDAAGRAPDYTELGAGNIGGLNLGPATYKWSTGVLIPADVTLTGGPNDVWIFEIAQGLTVSSGVKMNLAGGALAKNIFWQVSGIVDLGTTAHFEGIALGQTAIVLKTGASANGRLFAQTAVTLDANAVVQPAP